MKPNPTLVFFLLFTFLELQIASSQPRSKPALLTGMEKYNNHQYKISPDTVHRYNSFNDIKTDMGTVSFILLNDYTLYDIQSNGSAQQIWQDPLQPNNVHAVVMVAHDSGFSDLTTRYYFSSDLGINWMFLGQIPTYGRQGFFPVISGLSNGCGVVAYHSTYYESPLRGKISYDQGPGFGVFTQLDPMNTPSGPGFWPRIAVTSTNRIVFANSTDETTLAFTNSAVNIAFPGTFSGYLSYPGNNSETYDLAISQSGIIGHAYIGSVSLNPNDLFYRQSTDNGISWSVPIKVWDWDPLTDSIGCFRGLDLCFSIYNTPGVVFTTSKLTETEFYPGLPSEIRFWSPTVNCGVPKLIADRSNVPFYPNTGNTGDGYLPLCRPVLGRSTLTAMGIWLVAFHASTENTGSDGSRYYAVYTAFGFGHGSYWQYAEKVTPVSPLKDWRNISISPTNQLSGATTTFQMLCLADSVAGAFVTGSPQGRAEIVNIQYGLTIFHPGPDYAREITLSSPSNGLSNVSTTPVLKWNLSCEVENIDLRIARDPDFAEVVHSQSITPQDTQYQVPVNILSINTTYFWQVRVRNTGSIGTYTPAWSFSTTPVGISSIGSILPEKFELLQNYPNPFNPKTRIKFDVPKTSSVTIKIIDLSGKEVMTVVNSVLEAGSYEALIEAAHLASGTYFCRMESGSFRKTRKILLIK